MTDSLGYLRFSYYVLSQGTRRRKTIAVHILVYQTLKGEYDREQYEINHKDGNKRNDVIANLEVVTHTENVRHAVRNNLRQVKYSRHQLETVITMLRAEESWTDIFEKHLGPELKLTKQAAFSLINGVSNDPHAYAEKCEEIGFIKGSTARAKARTR